VILSGTHRQTFVPWEPNQTWQTLNTLRSLFTGFTIRPWNTPLTRATRFTDRTWFSNRASQTLDRKQNSISARQFSQKKMDGISKFIIENVENEFPKRNPQITGRHSNLYARRTLPPRFSDGTFRAHQTSGSLITSLT